MNNDRINQEIRKALQGNDFVLELNEDFNKATFMFDNNEYLSSLELDVEARYCIDDVIRENNTHNGNTEYEFEIVIEETDFEVDFDNLTSMEYEIKMEVDEDCVAYEYSKH